MSLYPQIRILLSAFVGVLLASLVATADQKCASILPTDATTNLIGYLGSMVEQGQITVEGLQALKDSIAEESLANPISIEQANGSITLQLHRSGLAQLLNESLDADVLAPWLTQKIEVLKTNSNSRNTVSEETRVPTSQLSFIKVKKGHFWMGTFGDNYEARKMEIAGATDAQIVEKLGEKVLKRRIHLLQDFEVMSTSITQQQWLDIMGSLPADLPLNKDFGAKIDPGSGQSYSPDLPVTNITFWSMLVFANKLSQFMGLEPVYKLKLEHFEGDPAKGTLQSTLKFGRPDGGMSPFSINAENGDYYKAQGFRLPTPYEMEYLGRYNQDEYMEHHFGFLEVDEVHRELHHYAWLDGELMPVGLKLPLVVEGEGEVFDYHGNISEVLYHWGEDIFRYSGLKDPVQENPYSLLWDVRKQHWLQSTPYSHPNSTHRHRIGDLVGFHIESKNDTAGFRLVRSLHD